MNSGRCSGFTIGELVIGVVFIGVVLGPFLLFASRVHELNSAVAQQARREAWRSFNDQAVAAGISPDSAAAFTAESNAAIPRIAAARVTQVAVAPVPGLPLVVPLHVQLDDSVAESRIAGAGLQLGAGPAVAPLSPPTPPRPPITMPAPAVTPPDGTVVDITSLIPAAADEPYTATVSISSAATNRVRARLSISAAAIQGLGTVESSVTATELLNGVSGSAWTEYAGDPGRGDRAVQLPDGRTRWIVTMPDGYSQTYEPSPLVVFAYRLDLGAPVLVRGAEEVASGSAVAVDYTTYIQVQNGSTRLKIDFPQSTRAAFGKTWSAQSIGFQWTFGASAGPFSGEVRPFFQSDTLAVWSDAVIIAASPVAPSGTVIQTATWPLTRVKTALGEPLLKTGADAGGFYPPGDFEFSAPPSVDGMTIGRLYFDGGAYLSTGPTLSISVIP